MIMKKLFNLDLHISVIADIKNIIGDIYKDEIEITEWSLSGHTWVFDKKPNKIEIINQNSWKMINRNMISKFNEKYRDFLSQFDGYIVTHTPVFCLLYEEYKKPIFLINSCRYEQPYCWYFNQHDFDYLNKKLYQMWNKKQIIAVSNNLGDLEYLKLGTNIQSLYIPSLCLYTKSIYNGSSNNFLVYDFNNYLPQRNEFVNRYKIPKYEFGDLTKYKAIIHIPYEISTMSIFEHYNMNIPLIFPSKTLLRNLIRNNWIRFQSVYYKFNKPEILKPAVDDNNFKWINFWLDKADYYNDNMPYILYFDNLNELDIILSSTNFMGISNKMAEFNNTKNSNIKNIWKGLFDANIF
jgi:hypothetical protein